MSSTYGHKLTESMMSFPSYAASGTRPPSQGCRTQSFPEFNIRENLCCDLKFAMGKGDRPHVRIVELHHCGTVRKSMANAHGQVGPRHWCFRRRRRQSLPQSRTRRGVPFPNLSQVARNEAPNPVARSSQKTSAATVNAGTTLFFRAITHTVFLAP